MSQWIINCTKTRSRNEKGLKRAILWSLEFASWIAGNLKTTKIGCEVRITAFLSSCQFAVMKTKKKGRDERRVKRDKREQITTTIQMIEVKRRTKIHRRG